MTLFKPAIAMAAAGFLLLLLPITSLASSPHGRPEPGQNKEANPVSGPVVVTIKPLYSLVAHLTEGIEQPELLMKQAQSPHHYNMRPSERRLLAEASVIIWVGPQLEPHLQKIIRQRENSARQSATVISVMQANGLKRLDIRNRHSHENKRHSKHASSAEQHPVDPHIWLSTANAAAISRHIAEQLILHSPEIKTKIEINLKQLLKKIAETRKFISSRLNNNRQPFIAYHDAFQYFENENALNHVDAINYDDETGTSLKHIRRIKARIEKHNIQCLVYQPPEPPIVSALAKQTAIKATALDPLGINLSNNKDAWFELMHQLAINFSHCLNNRGNH